ncbi:unnamed protein product [Sympodiomycopsis kandeliae]
MSTTHNYAPKSGFDSSGSSGLYHTARPDYPIEAIRSILQSSSAKELNILEIGSGTGISTECILREASAVNVTINKYLAIEPSVGMRQGWNKYIHDELVPSLKSSNRPSSSADVRTVDGTFEQLNLSPGQEGMWDIVLIAQAYHWCPDYEKSLKAIHNALRPSGGQLALIWNLEDNTTDAIWVKQLRNLYEVFEDGTPQYRHMYWKKIFDLPTLNDNFTIADKEGSHFRRVLPTTLEGVKNRVLSKSYISILSAEQQSNLEKDIEELFTNSNDEQLGRKWIDQNQGVFEYPYVTDLYLFQKKQ